jgi:hypothetical protein
MQAPKLVSHQFGEALRATIFSKLRLQALEELVFQTARNSRTLSMLWPTQKKIHLPVTNMIHSLIGFSRKCHQI